MLSIGLRYDAEELGLQRWSRLRGFNSYTFRHDHVTAYSCARLAERQERNSSYLETRIYNLSATGIRFLDRTSM